VLLAHTKNQAKAVGAARVTLTIEWGRYAGYTGVETGSVEERKYGMMKGRFMKSTFLEVEWSKKGNQRTANQISFPAVSRGHRGEACMRDSSHHVYPLTASASVL
jgi:hypothetical protein